MRIVWLCNIALPKIANELGIKINNSGGWLVGLSNDLVSLKSHDLSIIFPYTSNINKSNNEYRYFGFNKNSKLGELTNYFEGVLKSINPDVIHIFGTEYLHALAMVNACDNMKYIDKTVISIQGLVSVYSKHYFANLPNYVVNRKKITDVVKNRSISAGRRLFIERGKSEVLAIKKVKNIIGRTDWDKACTQFINPAAYYYKCNETLRDTFYYGKWDILEIERFTIFVSQSNYPIKGFHLLLEALNLIKSYFPSVKVYTTGSNPLVSNNILEIIKQSSYKKYIADYIRDNNLESHVVFLGDLNETEMKNRYLKSHVYVSASAIENSSNSIGEAMILGVPTVSSYVGGSSNLINHYHNGLLYQFDAPYMLAYYIIQIFSEDKLALNLSRNARESALNIHSRNTNLLDLINIYQKMVVK